MASSVKITNTMADKNYDKAISDATEAQLLEIAINIEGRAISNVPVDSGRLKGSITYALKDTRSNVTWPANSGDQVSRPSGKWVAHIGTNVEYAQHVEYGTVKMAKQPYLRPAFDASRSDIRRIMKKEIHEALKHGK